MDGRSLDCSLVALVISLIACLPSCLFPTCPLPFPLIPFKISLVQGPPTPCFTLKGLGSPSSSQFVPPSLCRTGCLPFG